MYKFTSCSTDCTALKSNGSCVVSCWQDMRLTQINVFNALFFFNCNRTSKVFSFVYGHSCATQIEVQTYATQTATWKGSWRLINGKKHIEILHKIHKNNVKCLDPRMPTKRWFTITNVANQDYLVMFVGESEVLFLSFQIVKLSTELIIKLRFMIKGTKTKNTH